jgi:WD40 repeat protein
MPEGNPLIPLRFGAQIVPPLDGGGVKLVVCGRVDGRPVALTCDGERSVQVWNLGDHQQLGRPITPRGHEPVWGVAYGVLDGRPVAVLVGGGVWVWDLTERRQISRARVRPYPPERHTAGGLWDVACTRLDGRLVAVTGGYDANVRIWEVATGKQLGDPLRGHTGVIRSVVCGVLHGRPIAVTGSEDHTVRIWDLDRREHIGRPLRGHTGQVWAVACGLFEGRPVAVSGSRDHTLRLWDLDDPDPSGTPFLGHTKEVDAVAFATVAGRTVAVSGGEDVRVWDLRTRHQAGPPLFDGRDIGRITSLACDTLRGRPVALAVPSGESVRVWDLEEHSRIGTDVPARYAAELPTSWTDPATGDVYDLTDDLVDAEGDGWQVVDYDGIEPIVGQHPLDPRVTFGIADAHAEYGFDDVVTPGPRRRKTRRVVHSTLRQYFEFQVLDHDRILSVEQLAELAGRYPHVTLSPTRMVWDFDPDDDDNVERPGLLLGERERDELLRSFFDAFLEFGAGGLRHLMFRLPTAQLNLEAVSPYLTNGYDGLSAEVRDSSLLLGFGHYEEDGELTHWRERPETWLKPLLPLRANLAGGDLSAAYMGWLKAVQEANGRDDLRPPPRPATFRQMSPQLKKLATLLHLNRWARKRLP